MTLYDEKFLPVLEQMCEQSDSKKARKFLILTGQIYLDPCLLDVLIARVKKETNIVRWLEQLGNREQLLSEKQQRLMGYVLNVLFIALVPPEKREQDPIIIQSAIQEILMPTFEKYGASIETYSEEAEAKLKEISKKLLEKSTEGFIGV